MTDIVETLLESRELYYPKIYGVCDEAAAEIKQNRIDLEEHRRDVERLRAALELGRKMRLTQVAYFKDRSRDMLIASKMAEAEFDKACAALGGE